LGIAWLPFVDVYRTQIRGPRPSFRSRLEQVFPWDLSIKLDSLTGL